MTTLKITKSSGNIFEDLGFEPQEAQNLQLRSQTMIALTKWFEASGLTQAMAAKTLGITQPRLNQLIKGKIEIFSLDALVNMAANAGMHVGLTIKTTSVEHIRVRNQSKLIETTGKKHRANHEHNINHVA